MLQYGSKIDFYIRTIEQSNQYIYLLSFRNEEEVNIIVYLFLSIIIVIVILKKKNYSLFL